jgi:hypothetical protein
MVFGLDVSHLNYYHLPDKRLAKLGQYIQLAMTSIYANRLETLPLSLEVSKAYGLLNALGREERNYK